MSDDLVKRLTFLASIIEMGEKIAWGSETSLMREAAARIEELEADIKGLRHMILDQINSTGDDPEIMAATRAEWAARALAAEANVAKAVEAVKSIKSDMDDRDDNGAYLTCKYIIAKLEGDSDEQTTDSHDY